MVPWAALPAVALARASQTAARKQARGKKLTDHGVDCATADLRRVAQAKWYAAGKTIPFHPITTFFALGSGILRAEELLLVTSEGVLVDELARELPIRHAQISDARIDELVRMATGGLEMIVPLVAALVDALGFPAAPGGPPPEDVVVPAADAAPHHDPPVREPLVELDVNVAGRKQSAGDRTWEAHLRQIQAFVADNGKLPRVGESYEGVKFGAWLEHFRRVGGTYQKTLTAARQAQLAAIPGWRFSEEAYAKGRALV
jgi:hypothetical protein